jgi:hypothetical protein
MSNAALLYPVFVQVLLTFVLLGFMGRVRAAAVKAKQVKLGDVALGQIDAWPPPAQQAARAFHNQLEMPILFYAAVAMAIAAKAVTLPMVVLAWAFVLLRLAHAAVHIGSNRVNQRFSLFIMSVFALLCMWVLLAWHVLTAGG